MIKLSDNQNTYQLYMQKLNQTNRYSILEFTRRIENSVSATLNETFFSSSSSTGSIFDNLSESFSQLTQNIIDLQTYNRQVASKGKTQSTGTGQASGSGQSAQTKLLNLPQMVSPDGTLIKLKNGSVTIKNYNNDYDINQSGSIGNLDNWQDDIDISSKQHDYDYNNDGKIDGKSEDISRLVNQIVKDRSFERAESQITGQLGLNLREGTHVEFYFSDRLFPSSQSTDGVTGLTVSTENPKIMMDLDEIMIQQQGVNQKVLVHEMTHAMMYSQLKSDNQATWFMEGAAVYTAGQGDDKITAALRTGNWNLKSLETLSNSATFDITGYAESYMAFKYIENFYGKDKIKQLVSSVLSTENVNLSIQQTMGISFSQFSQRVKDFSSQYLKQFSTNLYA